MSQKTYLNILKGGIYLSFLSVFLVFKNFLFPYISSKQLSFNILIEVLFIFWLVFIIKYPEYRPFRWAEAKTKKPWISIGLLSFFAVLTISCFTGINFHMSFWGNTERLLGVFDLYHFLIFYFIVITIMRTKKDWNNILFVSVAAAFLTSIYGIGQKFGWVYSPYGTSRIVSTIGNAAYVGAYTIFNIYFAVFLFFKDDRKYLKPFYLIAAFIVLIALLFSGTRGAYLGFGFSIIEILVLIVILGGNKKVKKYSLIAVVVLIASVALLFSNAKSNFVKNNSFLNRMTHISMQDATMQTRLLSWRAAWLDFPSHPLLGTGHGNYAITFDKYFQPIFYSYTASETYFDRAHNNLIDIASTTGILGLLTYLSIFVAVLIYIIRGYRRDEISLVDFLFVIGLITAYFIQNLVVFDSLVSYIPLMLLLGYVYWLSQGKEEGEILEKDRKLDNKEIFSFAIVGLIMIVVIYQYSVRPIQMLTGTINGQIQFSQSNVESAYNAYRDALSYHTVLDRDSRSSFVSSITANPSLLLKIKPEKAAEILNYAVSLAKQNLVDNPRDSLKQMQLAQIADLASRFYQTNSSQFKAYSDEAMTAINQSIASSPGRVPTYFIKAQIDLNKGDNTDAISTLKYAVSLNSDYIESTCQLAMVYLSIGQNNNGYASMDQCLDKRGSSYLNSASLIKNSIKHYLDSNDYDRVLPLYQRLTVVDSKDPNVWVDLAKLYAMQGMKTKAISAANKAAKLDSSLQSAVDDFIKGLR